MGTVGTKVDWSSCDSHLVLYILCFTTSCDSQLVIRNKLVKVQSTESLILRLGTTNVMNAVLFQKGTKYKSTTSTIRNPANSHPKY